MSMTRTLCFVQMDLIHVWMILSFVFLLNTFNGMFEHADVLFGILQKKTLDVQFLIARVNEFGDTAEQAEGRIHGSMKKQ